MPLLSHLRVKGASPREASDPSVQFSWGGRGGGRGCVQDVSASEG